MPVLVVMTGVPASGKSFFVEKNFPQYTKIRKELFVERQSSIKGFSLEEGYEFLTTEDFHEVNENMYESFLHEIRKGGDIVIDAENVLKSSRLQFDIKDYNYYKVSVFVDTPLTTCLKRNMVSAHPISEQYLLSLYSLLEVPETEFFAKTLTVSGEKKY